MALSRKIGSEGTGRDVIELYISQEDEAMGEMATMHWCLVVLYVV